MKEHVNQEWMLNNVFHPDEPVFFVTDFDDGLQRIQKHCEVLPISFVYRKAVKNDGNRFSGNDIEDSVKKWFEPDEHTEMIKTTICDTNSSNNFFYKQQRDRKIWWRKLSALPGRFSTSEIINTDQTESVDLTADFPWGLQKIETIKQTKSQITLKNGRKNLAPNLITSCVNLELAALIYMCDAYDPLNEETNRNLMRFHRKLAPYKITFAINGSSSISTQQLSELALVLARKIRKIGIPCLLLPDAGKRSLESSFLRADGFGIPYTVILNDKTLTDGMLGIRNRDTTLKEQSHVGVIVSHVEQIMKNY